jgi:hypothetical protein
MAEQVQFQFDAPADDQVSAYLASGLTALTDDQLTIVELLSGLLSEFCSAANVLVHQPVMHTHPKDHADLEPHEVHQRDFAKVIASDAVIALGDFASWGGGKELVWAERLRLPVLLLVKKGASVSKLVLGTTGDIERHEWRFHNEVREAWQTFFLKRKAQLETHRRLRASRAMLWGPTLGRFLATYRSLDEVGRTVVTATSHLMPGRIGEMLSSPLALAEASLDEVTALSGALGLPSATMLPGEPSSALPPRALVALGRSRTNPKTSVLRPWGSSSGT